MATITAQSIISKLNVGQTLSKDEQNYLKDNQKISQEVDKKYNVSDLLNGKVTLRGAQPANGTSSSGSGSTNAPTSQNGNIPLNGAPSLNPSDIFTPSNPNSGAQTPPSSTPMPPTNLPTAIQGAIDTLNKAGGAEKEKALQELYSAKSALQAMDEKSNDATSPLEASKIQLTEQEKIDAAKVSASDNKVQVTDKNMQEAQELKQRVETEKDKVQGELQTAKGALDKSKQALIQAKENVTKGKTAKGNCETKLKDSTAAYHSAKQAAAQALAANNPSTPATSAALMKAQSQEKVAEAQMKADEVALKKAETELKQFEVEEKKSQAQFDKDTANVEKLDKALNGTKEEVAQAIAKEDKATQDLSLAQSEQTEANRLLNGTQGATQNNEVALNQAVAAVSQQRQNLIAQIDAQIKALGGETGEKQGILGKAGSWLGSFFSNPNAMNALAMTGMMANQMFGQQQNQNGAYGQNAGHYGSSGGQQYQEITQADIDRINKIMTGTSDEGSLNASANNLNSRAAVNQASTPGLSAQYGGATTNIAKFDIGGANISSSNIGTPTSGDSIFTQAKKQPPTAKS